MNSFPTHHPDDNLLIEFSSGAVDKAQAIAVSAHLHYCTQCRNRVEQYNAIGGALLEVEGLANYSAEKHPIHKAETRSSVNESTNHTDSSDEKTFTTDTLSFDQLMDAIDTKEAADADSKQSINTQQPIPAKYRYFPSCVQKLVSTQKVNWVKVTSNLHSANLISGQNKYGVYLQKINAGGRVPEHDHRGEEITVVLKGSISDEDGVYNAGDFLIKHPGDIHLPIASSNESCVCLSIQEAPVKLTSLAGRLLNPFLRINAV